MCTTPLRSGDKCIDKIIQTPYRVDVSRLLTANPQEPSGTGAEIISQLVRDLPNPVSQVPSFAESPLHIAPLLLEGALVEV